jgi:serine/alanine adding enzyme
MAEAGVRIQEQPVISPLGDATEEWDAFVRSSDGATFCHLAAWRPLLAEVMGHQPVYLEARNPAGDMVGALPMFRLRSRIFGSRMVSMPFLNYGGPIGEASAVAALLERAVQEARHAGVKDLELRTRTATPSRPTALAVTDRKVTVLLPLPSEPEELWNAFKAKVRSQIRRPMKEEMEPRFGPEQVESFYHVYSHNMRDLGTPVLPKSFFQRAAAALPEESIFAAVYHEERPVAVGAGFLFGGEFEISWASALREHSRHAPNMLLYWSLMEEVIRRGATMFNFGRCTPGEGTHRFKRQWGGHDHPLPWLSWPKGRGEDSDEPGRLVRLASAAWQRLPVLVANRVGPAVARQLPWW